MTEEVLTLALHRNATIVENAMREAYVEDKDIASLLNAEQYSLFAGGKRVRPALTLEFCKLFGGEEEAAIPFACAVEMIHTYSLIHDDLPCMDNDDLRRGKPTNHKVFGETVALLAGDSLLTGAFEIAASNREAGAEASAMAVAYLANCAGRYGMIGGQIMDIEGERRKLTLDELLKLHSLKTGALISAACVMGALAAGVRLDDKAMQDVIVYAENIGLAFQIVDDLLDLEGDVAALGKETGMDAQRGKMTWPAVCGVEQAREDARKAVEEAIAAMRLFGLQGEKLSKLAQESLVRKM